jgi:hypothetical protein
MENYPTNDRAIETVTNNGTLNHHYCIFLFTSLVLQKDSVKSSFSIKKLKNIKDIVTNKLNKITNEDQDILSSNNL